MLLRNTEFDFRKAEAAERAICSAASAGIMKPPESLGTLFLENICMDFWTPPTSKTYKGPVNQHDRLMPGSGNTVRRRDITLKHLHACFEYELRRVTSLQTYSKLTITAGKHRLHSD